MQVGLRVDVVDVTFNHELHVVTPPIKKLVCHLVSSSLEYGKKYVGLCVALAS